MIRFGFECFFLFWRETRLRCEMPGVSTQKMVKFELIVTFSSIFDNQLSTKCVSLTKKNSGSSYRISPSCRITCRKVTEKMSSFFVLQKYFVYFYFIFFFVCATRTVIKIGKRVLYKYFIRQRTKKKSFKQT